MTLLKPFRRISPLLNPPSKAKMEGNSVICLLFISAARMEKDDGVLTSICDTCDSLEKQGSDANPYLLAVYRSLKGEILNYQ